MRRRDLLALTAAAALAPLAAPALAAAPQTAGAPKRLVVVLLRGAVDGLNVVIPYADEAYYAARPTIAVQRPEAGEGAGLALDDHFALHPALAALMPLWRERQLAFVHAAGSSDPTRSHFDAQLFVENGTPGRHATADGWMNRLLAALPGPRGPTDAIAIGPTLPAILRGPLTVANLPLGQAAGHQLAIDRPEIASAFDRLYAGGGPLGRAYREGRAARAELLGQIGPEPQAADGGSLPANGFPAQAARLAHLLSRNRRTRLAFVALGGWDTHVRQGGAQGQLAERLQPLGDGLAALAHGLGSDWNDTVVVVVSEFGRTVRENGDGGTDHGHGNAIWVLGGSVRGGRVYGEWPGLSHAQLYEGRDLGVTTDFRSVLASVGERHLRLSDRAIAAVFPGLPPAGSEIAGIVG